MGILGINSVESSSARTLTVAPFCVPASGIADVPGTIYLVGDSACYRELAASWILWIVTAEHRERVDRHDSETRELASGIAAGHQMSIVLQLDVAVEDAELGHVLTFSQSCYDSKIAFYESTALKREKRKPVMRRMATRCEPRMPAAWRRNVVMVPL